MSQHLVVLLLGSNKGNKKKNIEEAIEELKKNTGTVIKTGKVVETKPVEFVSSENFLNIALILETKHSPVNLLDKIKKIEQKFGRNSDSKVLGGYQDRIIDIDIVTYDTLIFESERLSIPHKKHLFERDFSKAILNDLRN